ncbi:hypothetical protein B0H14DRAFT_3504537 [Mycena olivaceomarginata]|nr:hypothetical protein B0H14DRAFT_3504537 [Mycena olivaceomarginata]
MAQDNGSGDDNDEGEDGCNEGEDGRASGKDSGKDSAEDDDEHDRKRRIVDFTVDDPDWEDMQDGIAGDLGTTTHRSRNPHLLANPLCKRHRAAPGPNACASASRRREAGGKRLDVLAKDLDAWEVEREERVHTLADKHHMKPAEVRRRMLALSTYGGRQKVSTYNAKISRIMADLNADRGVRERYRMPEVKAMVAQDPSMLDRFSNAENKQMVEDVLAKRRKKTRGTRAKNLAAVADAKQTMDRLMTEIANLAERVGMIGFAMFSRGHIHDKTLPVTIQSWGAMDFFTEVLRRDPADVSHLFELWAVSRERGKGNKNKLLSKQQEATALIMTGLQTVLGVTKCAMNYENYIEKLVRGKGVGMVNWLAGVDFERMSLQSAIGPLQTLLDSLKSGTTWWKKLTARETEQLIAQYEEMVGNGEVAGKKKSRSTATRKAKKAAIVEEEEGGDNDEEEGGDNDEEEERGDNDEEEEEEAPHAGKPAAKGKRPATSSKRGAVSGKASGEGPPHVRKVGVKGKGVIKPACKTAARNDDNGSDEGEPPAPPRPAKRKCVARNDDDRSAEEDPPTPRPAKRKRAAPKAESHTKRAVKQMSANVGSVQNKLWVLVQKGREANDAAQEKRKREWARAARDGNRSDEEGSGRQGGGSRKKAGDEEGAGAEGGAGKKKRKTVGGEDGPTVQPPRPRPKPLHKKKSVVPPAGNEGGDMRASADDGAAAPRFVVPSTRSKPSVGASTVSNGRVNTVREKAGGPPGVRIV